MSAKYTIRAFEKRCGISVDRLRHYEKLGLIHPKRDDSNGYRYYSDDLLLDVQMVCYFQSLRIQLKDIGAENHRCKPAVIEDWVDARIESLRAEVFALQSQIRMLETIQTRIPEMTAQLESVRDWTIAPRYLLYYTGHTDDAIREWMGHMPYVGPAIVVRQRDFEEASGPIPITHALEIVSRQAERIGLGHLEAARRLEERPGIRFATTMRDPLHPTRDDFAPMLSYMEKNGLEPAGDWLCGVRGIDEDARGRLYYVRIMVPTRERQPGGKSACEE